MVLPTKKTFLCFWTEYSTCVLKMFYLILTGCHGPVPPGRLGFIQNAPRLRLTISLGPYGTSGNPINGPFRPRARPGQRPLSVNDPFNYDDSSMVTWTCHEQFSVPGGRQGWFNPDQVFSFDIQVHWQLGYNPISAGSLNRLKTVTQGAGEPASNFKVESSNSQPGGRTEPDGIRVILRLHRDPGQRLSRGSPCLRTMLPKWLSREPAQVVTRSELKVYSLHTAVGTIRGNAKAQSVIPG
jgi:hypothetical protein